MHVPGPAQIRRRILLVDDELSHRILTATLLQGAGYSPTAVGTVARALERIGRDGPELVLTDLVMPGLDGLDLLRALRAMHADPLAIAMTASDDRELVDAAYELGALAVLRKPFRGDALVDAVRAAFDAADDMHSRKIA
jgi:two-component system C4-dicarboxylate transport response regulator DctD